MIKLSIVFLNFNRLSETRKNVEQLLKLTDQRPGIEIIAVDNGSQDGTRDYLLQQQNIISLLLDDNGGIAGYNKGFKRARGEYLLVLDDDSCPKDGQTIDNLIKLLDEHQKIGIIACHIENLDGSPQWSWHLPEKEKFGPSPFFVGCGFAIRKKIFSRIDWYPEQFFLYQNEIDVTFKVRQLGYQVYYSPDCRVVHRGQPGTRPGWRRIYYPTRNTIWLIQKYYPRFHGAYMLCSRLIIGFVRAVYFRELPTYVKAVKDAFNKPVRKQVLSAHIREETLPFCKQNSIFHHLFKRT